MSASTEKFDELVTAYYRTWFRYHPEAAVEAGVHGYEQQLTPFGDEARGALVYLNNELHVSLDELDRGQLDADRQIDFQLLYGAAQLENQRLLDVEPERPDPGQMLPINALYQLTIRAVPDIASALIARLAAVPAHLQGARDYLRSKAAGIPPLWLDSAVTAARRGAEFIRDLAAVPKLADLPRPPVGLALQSNNAAGALADYAEFLDSSLRPQAKGEFACGTGYFEHLLRHRHFLEVGSGELRALGQQIFDQTQRDLEDACARLMGTRDTSAAMNRIHASHPAREDVLPTYRNAMRAAREFVVTHDLVTIPDSERLDVVETPVFLRHQIPFAAYSEPSPNDPAQQGYYYVTPPQDKLELAQHDHAGLMHTCVHEAWPGHHLQFVTANRNPASRTSPRFLNTSATLYEGWALYCEQMMQEQGFLDQPEQRLILLRDRLWRALRIVLDVDIHTRGLGLDEAADLMVRHLGFPRPQALADLTWYTKSPTVPMGYATGWAIINALRDRLRAEEPGLALRAFHDKLLSAGSIALPLVIARVFGPQRWASIRQSLFASGASGG